MQVSLSVLSQILNLKVDFFNLNTCKTCKVLRYVVLQLVEFSGKLRLI